MISKENLKKLRDAPITDKFIESPAGQRAIAKGKLDFYRDYYNEKA